MLDPQQEEKRKERRVRQMLNTYYGAMDGKMEGDIDPTSVDSMLFDVEKYFNDVLRGQNLPSIHSMMNKYQQEKNDINSALKSLVVENYSKFLGVHSTMTEINTKMGGIVAEMEKLNNQVDAIVSDVAHLDSRFARSQGEGARLAKMQDLVKKLQYVSSIPDKLHAAVDTEAYEDASRYFLFIHKALTKYLHIPSFKMLYDQCCEYVVGISQTLKERLIDPKLSERESADLVDILLNFGSSPEQLRALFLYGRSAAIEYNWYADEKSSTVPGDPLASLRERNRAFFTHLLMSSHHFKRLFATPESEVAPVEIVEPRSSKSPPLSHPSEPSWKRLSKSLSPKMRDSQESTGRDSPVPAQPRSDSPRQIETPMEDWNKFVIEHFVKYLSRSKVKIMESNDITEKSITMQALSVDISQVHRQMPEIPIQAIDDLITDVINHHISKAFASLQDTVIEKFRQLQTSVSETKSLDDATSIFQDDLEKNTHFVISHLQSVMNTLTEMFSSTETQFFKESYEVWITKVQIKLQQFLLTVITVCSEMCDYDYWPKYMKPAFILSIVHMCLFFKKRGLAQIQKTLDNIISGIEKKDVDSDDEDSIVSFSQIITELRYRCKETSQVLILVYISAHCKGFERMIKKLLETSNWLKAREPREVKLGTALIVDEFFKIFIEVSTLFSILPTPKFSRPKLSSGSGELRYSATSPPQPPPLRAPTGMVRAPSLPTIGSTAQVPPEDIKVRHGRTASALPSFKPTAALVNTLALPRGQTGMMGSKSSGTLPRSSSGLVGQSTSGTAPKNTLLAPSNPGTLPRVRSSLYVPVLEEEIPVTFVPDEFKCSATYILFRIVQYIFKSFMERVRTKTMSRGGCQQVDVDTEYLQLAFMKVIPDSRIEGFAKAVQKEAASRAADPHPLQKKIIQQLCKEKAQAHHITL